jgi:hypothetical protein
MRIRRACDVESLRLGEGFGIAVCRADAQREIGAGLEAQVALSRIAQRMPDLQLLPGAERSMRARFRGFRRLPAMTN